MILHDFECPRGHVFEKMIPAGTDFARCPTCKKRAAIAYLPRNRRSLSDPIVFYKCADGKYSFPGRSNAPPPKDMVERIECRTIQDYDRAMSRVNGEYESQAGRRAEGMERMHGEFRREHREALNQILGQTNDNYAKDLIREALKRKNSDYEPTRHSRLYSEAMEFDASNREGEWRRGSRDRK